MCRRSLFMEVKGLLVVEDARTQTGAIRSRRLDALEQVANRPIAHHVVEALASAGVTEIVVASCRAVADEVKKSLASLEPTDRVELTYVEQAAPLDLIGALKLAAPTVGTSACIVHVANGLLADPLPPLMDYLQGESPNVVVVVHQGSSPVEHLSAATLKMLHVAELDRERDALGMAGVCLFGQGALRRASIAPWRPAGQLDLTILADQITGARGSFHVLPINTWRRYAGDPFDLLELNRIALDCLDAQPAHPSNHGNRVEGRVWIHERASVRASVIVGPSVIGPEAQIADAYIGPYTSVGAGARIEGAEIERSIVAPGASIMHVGGRLVASVVGRNARVLRDFSVPRAMRLHVGDDTEVALC